MLRHVVTASPGTRRSPPRRSTTIRGRPPRAPGPDPRAPRLPRRPRRRPRPRQRRLRDRRRLRRRRRLAPLPGAPSAPGGPRPSRSGRSRVPGRGAVRVVPERRREALAYAGLDARPAGAHRSRTSSRWCAWRARRCSCGCCSAPTTSGRGVRAARACSAPPTGSTAGSPATSTRAATWARSSTRPRTGSCSLAAGVALLVEGSRPRRGRRRSCWSARSSSPAPRSPSPPRGPPHRRPVGREGRDARPHVRPARLPAHPHRRPGRGPHRDPSSSTWLVTIGGLRPRATTPPRRTCPRPAPRSARAPRAPERRSRREGRDPRRRRRAPGCGR